LIYNDIISCYDVTKVVLSAFIIVQWLLVQYGILAGLKHVAIHTPHNFTLQYYPRKLPIPCT